MPQAPCSSPFAPCPLLYMKKLILFLSLILPVIAAAQQVPISENYFLDKYSLAPSYAGNYNPGFLFLGYRSDWTGIEGGPKTMRISYNDALQSVKNVGLGGRVIYDKAGIFGQLYALSSYSYNLKVNRENRVLFGFSAGVYKNSVNLAEYYNDPTYNLDPSLTDKDIKSKIKFMSDFSVVWLMKDLEAGFLFSNITFGDASYKEINLKYNPLANFQFHTTYNYKASDFLSISPLLMIRGGKFIKSQFEFATRIMYAEKFWGSAVYRDPGILGFGIGAGLDRIRVAYNFNMATNVVMGAFNNHEISLGINIFEKKRRR